MLKEGLYVLVMLTSIPVGFLMAWLCSDEIEYRKWFYLLLVGVGIVFVVSLFVYMELVWLLTLVYFVIVILIGVWKGKDKKFVN